MVDIVVNINSILLQRNGMGEYHALSRKRCAIMVWPMEQPLQVLLDAQCPGNLGEIARAVSSPTVERGTSSALYVLVLSACYFYFCFVCLFFPLESKGN